MKILIIFSLAILVGCGESASESLERQLKETQERNAVLKDKAQREIDSLEKVNAEIRKEAK